MKTKLRMNSKSWIYVGLLVSIVCGSAAPAHDLVDSGGSRFKWDPARAAFMPNDVKQAVPRPGSALLYVVVLPNRWAVGQVLHICFYGGSSELRGRIVSTASLWLKYANLKFDSGGPGGRECARNDASEIRIGFSEPGYWSYIGNQSVDNDLVSKNLSSMNFQGFDNSPPPEPEFTSVVLHEFGHALGFHHEHQSPAEGCDKEYNWTKLYSYYQNQYGWNKTMVDQNVRQLMSDRSAYDWSSPDPKSIMVYASDPQFLIKGTSSSCYFHENFTLSAADISGASRTYPQGNIKQILKDQVAQLIFLTQHGGREAAMQLATQLQITKAQLAKSP